MGRNIGVEQKSHQKDEEKAKKRAENNYCVSNFKWMKLSFRFSSICENVTQQMSETS